MAIKTFGDAATEDLFHGRSSARVRRIPQDIWRPARRKLLILHAAVDLDDLRSPPGNRLEALSGDLQDYHSIRINRQWRVVFIWKEGNAYEVRVIDYH